MSGSRKRAARPSAALVSLPARAGTHLPLPSGHSILAGLALLAVAAGGYAVARTSSLFAVEQVRVEGATPALARKVREALSPSLGTSLIALDGAAVVGRVEQLPEVRSAVYDRAFPHTLVVTVRRERPAAVLRRGSESWLVSARGRVIRPLRRRDHPRLPRVWVPRGTPVAPGAVLAGAGILRAAGAAAVLLDEPLPRRVTAVRAGEGDLAFRLAGGLELRLGDPSELRLKLAVAREVLPLVEPGTLYLDLSVPERPVAGTTLDSEVEVEG